jgi:hypothetical protein
MKTSRVHRAYLRIDRLVASNNLQEIAKVICLLGSYLFCLSYALQISLKIGSSYQNPYIRRILSPCNCLKVSHPAHARRQGTYGLCC